ncbi:TonB-dependent receptor domain-containing protein [uncultured Desulfuromusa sp.]|uniref:TonB-dependent receptor plug domain-containing protein n=1 Tax=uncultured Desulfuromusa sp. TaxID=219183 RepID=UPI002AA8A819|nr:TonB-dependent receptor [uncultured Desulfuromusa sp.]
MKRSFIVLFTLLLTAGPLWADAVKMDPVVVTATRVGTPLSQIASSVTVITAEEIEAKQQTQLLDVLRSVPGVSLVQTGSPGAQTSIFLRGTDTRHTLLLIDGIEYRDASSSGGGPALENLTTDNIKQIEIVRGPQSVLYGSDAIGGVINIITKKGSQQPEGYASIEGGSYNTWIEKAGFSAGSETVSSSFSASRTDSDGFSSANEKDGNNEEDGYENTTLSFNLGAELSEIFSINLNVHSDDSTNDYDAYGPVDGDYNQETELLAGRLEGNLKLLDGRWNIAIGAAKTDKNRIANGPVYSDRYEYDGKITKLDMLNTILLGKNNTLILGAETEKDELESFSYLGDYSSFPTVTYTPFRYKESVTNNAIYIQDQITVGQFSAAIGLRHDDHDQFGGKTTWRFAPTYNLTSSGTRLKASVGTGFKAPTLYQLYGQLPPYNVGNEDLQPEESFGWDLGFEQSLLNSSVLISFTYFHNDIDDYIDYDYSDGYLNVDGLITQGVESSVAWYPSSLLDVTLGYTYTDSKNKKDNSRLLRRPLHKGTFDLNIYPVEKLQINLNAIYTSERDDDETLPEYTLVNLAASYQITDNCKIFSRVDNLFDKEYEEVTGYGTAELSGYAGIKLTF